MVFQPTGPGPRTARVKIVQNARKFRETSVGSLGRRTPSSGSACRLTPNGTLCQPMGETSRSPTKTARLGTSPDDDCRIYPACDFAR